MGKDANHPCQAVSEAATRDALLAEALVDNRSRAVSTQRGPRGCKVPFALEIEFSISEFSISKPAIERYIAHIVIRLTGTY